MIIVRSRPSRVPVVGGTLHRDHHHRDERAPHRGAARPPHAIARSARRHAPLRHLDDLARPHHPRPRCDPADEGATKGGATCAGAASRVRQATARRHRPLQRTPRHRQAACGIADGPTPTRSDLEDLLIDLLDAAGIERPEINAALRLDGDHDRPRLHVARPQARDRGRQRAHDHKLVREHDAEKQAILEANGWRVLRIDWRQTLRRPQQTLARIDAALVATS
jgi:hypothetical protein